MIDKLLDLHRNPVTFLLHTIGGIVAVYGLWAHRWPAIIIAIALMAIGHLFPSKSKERIGKNGKPKAR